MTTPLRRIATLLVLTGVLAACGDESTDETAASRESADLIGNRAPVISGEPVQWVLASEEFAFQPEAFDPDGDDLIFAISGMPAWLDFDNRSGRLAGMPEAGDVGAYRGIVISVNDGQEEALLPPINIEVLARPIGQNEAPSISGNPGSEARVGSFYSFIPTASDAEGDALTFQVVNRPGWAQFDNSTGRLSGTPGAVDVGPYVGITIRVNDGMNTSELGPFTINVNNPLMTNTAPVISGTPVSSVTAGQSWSFAPQASDADGDALTFEVFNAPSWAFFSASSGQMSGTPDEGDVGTHTGITIVVTDGRASASLPSFAIQVISANSPPTISGNPSGTARTGESYSFTPQASDTDGDSLSFSIQNRPTWLTFSESTGALFGTPDVSDVGTYNTIVISVSDGQSLAVLSPFTIAVGTDVAPRSAVLSWAAPTQNIDGSDLVDLVGFNVYWGTEPGNYTDSHTINDTETLTYVVEDLQPATTYYFAVTAFNSNEQESVPSLEGSKTIAP